VGFPRVEAAERREVGTEAFDSHLVDPLRPVETLEVVLPKIVEPDTFRKGSFGQCAGRLGDQDLAAVGRGGDAGGPVDVDSHVVVPTSNALPAVEAHPDADFCSLRPVGPVKRSLRGDGRSYRRWRIFEYDEKPIALSPPLDTVVGLEGGSQETVVLFQQFSISGRIEFLDQSSRALYVAE